MGNERCAIRVLLADDQALFRKGINVVLNGESDIEVVAEAQDGATAIDQSAELAPDVVLMDVRMPGVGGIEAARAIKSTSPSTSILMLTMSDEEDDLYEAVKAGASGYLLKEVSVATVAGALRSVTQGESFISPSMAAKLLSEFNYLTSHPKPGSTLTPLTQRETEVLRMVAMGHTNNEIGDTLGITENTVKNHVRNTLEKLHLHDRMEAAVYALESRIAERNQRVAH